MGKKPFIDKNNSQKFHLLHRSQLDQAHAQEGTPSEYVLVPAENIVQTRTSTSGFAPNNLNVRDKFESRRDHINELGFKNDGYDYSQHLKEMGGGKFIGKDGKVGETPKYIELPEDVLPSTGMDLQRDLQAITISAEFMDADLHAALFEDEDEEGEFEALDDDFVLQVAQEPEVPDFDFDAHIAALIAKSEQSVGFNKPRGWDDEKSRKMKPLRNKTYENGGFGDIIIEGEYEEEDEDYDDDESGEFDVDELMAEQEGGGESQRVMRHMDPERQAALDLQFEKTLAEYDDEQIGDLEEDMEGSDMEGEIDLEEFEAHEGFNQALDDYLQDQKDRFLAEGTFVKKGARNVLLLKKNDADEYVHEELYQVDANAPVDIKQEYAEQVARQAEWAESIEQMKIEAKEYEKDLATCQEYLRESRIEDEWDCETIISTYSTLDNHPTVIRDAKSKFKPYKNKFQRDQEEAAALAYSDTASLASSVSKRSSKVSLNASSNPIIPQKGKIILSGKLNLPEGFGPGNAKPAKKNNNTTRGPLSAIQEKVDDDDDEEEEESQSESECESDAAEEASAAEGDKDNKVERPAGWVEKEKKVKARKKETAEEKKARKAATKEERKSKRAGKKQLKNTFKQEGNSMIRSMASEQSINHVSVFKYSN